MLPKKKNILISIGIFVALMLLIMAILPVVMRTRVSQEIGQLTGRKTTLQSLTFNPLTMTVTAGGFAMEERGGGPFISVGSVRASLSPLSIFKRALIVSAVTIDNPAINIIRKGPNSYNFTDIMERLKSKEKPKPKEERETRYSINNIVIKRGSVDFNDLAVDGGRKHTVRNLEIGVPFISNIPYLVEKYTDPKISAVVNGAPFSFAGKMKPLSRSMETSVRITLRQLDLPELAAYSPQKPPARLARGKLTIDTDLRYRVYSDKKPELSIRGLVRLDDVIINMNNGQPLVKLPQFAVNISNLEIFAKLFTFDAIRLNGAELFVSRDGRGRWMYSSLIPEARHEESGKARADKPGGVPQPSLMISSLAITKSSVHFSDALPREGFRGSLSDISVSLKNVSNAPKASAKYELSLLVDNDAKLTSSGDFSLSPLAAKASTKLAGLKLQKGWPYMASYLTAPVKGVLDLTGDVSYTPENGLIAEHGGLDLRDLSTRYGKKDGVALSHFSVSDMTFKQKENRLDIALVKLSKGNIAVSREQNGQISLLSLLKTPTPATTEKPQPKRKQIATKSPSPQLKYHLKQFRTDGLNLAFTDRSREGSPRFTLRNSTISLVNLNGPKFTPAQLGFSAIFGKKTPLRANGEITPLPFRYRGNLRVGRLPIRDFEDYFPDNLNVDILNGYLDTNLRVDVALKNGKPQGTFRGSAGVRSFHSIDTVSEEDLLKWESLQLGEFQGKLEPFTLSVRQIALNGLYSRIIILKDGTLNLQNLVEKPDGAPAATAQPAAPSAKQAPAVPSAVAPSPPRNQAAGAAKPQISIGAITIQGGTLAFSDNHLPQKFSTTFYNLGGRVSGMSSEESKFADVDLRGNLENHSPLLITGKINPLRDDLFVDLKISFKDIELSPVTPYSGTYLGYTVEKGKLFLDLMYHIEKKQLSSQNRIFIDQFTFGNRVESKQATSLPVKLGLALLKDRKGEIHLDIPVTGRTDDPKFSIWRLVFQVLRNLLVKAATSPLSLLSSMFGGGADLSSIQFPQGTSVLPHQEEQKLDTLAKALKDRPALKIELRGYVDRERDIEGYRSESLNRKMLNEKKLALARERQSAEGKASAPLKVLPEEYSKYLKLVYKKEKFPKPRNMFGFVKELPDSEIKKLIITNTVVSDNDLQSLAQERSAEVMNYLVGKCSIPAERIFLKKDNIHKAPEKSDQSGSRVELNAIAP